MTDERPVSEYSEYSQDEEASIALQSPPDEAKVVHSLFRRETANVRFWRFLVSGVMVAIALATSIATHSFLTQQETNDFVASFNQLASTIIDSSQFSASAIRRSFGDLSDHITSYATATNSSWPFVTFPDFEIHGENLRIQTESVGLWILPFVSTASEAHDWGPYTRQNDWFGEPFVPVIHTYKDDAPSFDIGTGPYAPIWQIDPRPLVAVINYDMRSSGTLFNQNMDLVEELREGVVGQILDNSGLAAVFPDVPGDAEPFSVYEQPIFDTFDRKSNTIVAVLEGFLRWGKYLENVLPSDIKGIVVVLENTCDQTNTWELVGEQPIFLGRGDLHDTRYDYLRQSTEFNTYEDTEKANALGACLYTLHVYPSASFESDFKSNTPLVLTLSVTAVFGFMVLTFVAYNKFVHKRNEKVLANAARSNEIVASLFPSNVRSRLFQADASKGSDMTNLSDNGAMESFLDRTDAICADEDLVYEGKPIADLFPEATIMFADIVGFTAWSSVREPTQVFTLLETVYRAFDQIAKRRRIFKVETVGDCYVAVAGVPDPRSDHAVVMCRFSYDIVAKFSSLVKRLETTLGPDTGDLSIRVGLHSGPVTAGVLRGDRSRFQLFGDTMNTAARMESTGVKNRIHLSQETAEILIVSGKSHWITAREERVNAKGKGELKTYWMEVKHQTKSTDSCHTDFEDDDAYDAASIASAPESPSQALSERLALERNRKLGRLIDWNVDVLARLLKQVVARREAIRATKRSNLVEEALASVSMKAKQRTPGHTVLDEVTEIIKLPCFDPEVVACHKAGPVTELEENVHAELRDYVSTIAHLYRSNEFHNYEHASHVAMSVTKLLSRIVAPSTLTNRLRNDENTHAKKSNQLMESSLHDHTYGITSDPLTQFAVVFSALIHDVDHVGVPNAQLVKENASVATIYKNKSVLEQNSVDVAWSLLSQDRYNALRKAICDTQEESRRFRQLVVNTVLATDIVDKELKSLRNNRWEKAFCEQSSSEDQRDTVNRKATIVIEHLIQASDVAHTMQHWHVYRKWNERFFRECYKAYTSGRAERDPAETWYQGELGFYDFYIIPLARKLKECGVFGVSSDEFLNYAMQNRREWEARGLEIVAEMSQKIRGRETSRTFSN